MEKRFTLLILSDVETPQQHDGFFAVQTPMNRVGLIDARAGRL